MQQTTLQQEFIRDITSVVPMSKSEAKRRLDDILLQQRKEIVEEIKHNFEDVICFTDKTNNAAYTSICFQGTSKGANLSDIITKLSESK